MSKRKKKKCKHCGFVGEASRFMWHGRSTGHYCPMCYVVQRNKRERERRLCIKHSEDYTAIRLTDEQFGYLSELVINEVPDIYKFADECKLQNQMNGIERYD